MTCMPLPVMNLMSGELIWGSEVDRIWLWVDYNKIPIYPVFYLLN